jgi:hypothetical protein
LEPLQRIRNFIIFEDDSDDRASTYWITNPIKSFVGNVAAGSESIGFWFEPMKRGSRAALKVGEQKSQRLTLFQNNTAHSNTDFGIRTYPRGYSPSKIGDFNLIGSKVYHNVDGGIFIHNSQRIMVSNSLFANNDSKNIDIDKFLDAASVFNTTIVVYWKININNHFYDENICVPVVIIA